MRKCDELTDPNSCFNKARPGERLFVLLCRDQASPGTIRYWVGERIEMGLNRPEDAQIREALECARKMEEERESEIPVPDAASAGGGGG